MSGAVDGPVRVLYFAGSGRSGTTVMNSILGQVEGIFAAGELRYLWHRGVVGDHRCGCGLPFSGCPVWTGVMKDLGLAHPGLDAQGIGDRLLRRLRIARVPLILGRRALGRPGVPPHSDDAAIAALYRSIATRTDATVIVDSSKLPPYGLLVSGLPDVELYVLHVVRDPRATAFSWRRQKKTLDTGEDGALMARLPIWKSSALWLLWNSLTAMWWRGRADHYLQVRYEEFGDRPQETMARVAQLLGLDPAVFPFESPTTVRLKATHSVAGNANRHTSGLLQIRPDAEWRASMAARERRIVTAITAVGLRRFGYRLRPADPR